jgi:hypothetical protein
VKLSFIIEREIKTFHDKQKLKHFSQPTLQKILKVIPHTEEEEKCNQKNIGKNKSH